MAVLPGEGTHPILYGSTHFHSGISGGRGYLARPDLAGSFPALLVAHDLAGLSSFAKALVRRLARHGYAVLAPELRHTQRHQAQRSLTGAHDFLSNSGTPWAQPGDFGVVTIGMGSEPAVSFAADRRDVSAFVLLYGALPVGLNKVDAPLLGLYGRSDEHISLDAVRDAGEGRPDGEWVIYSDAGHAFMDDSSDDYRQDVAEDAFARLLAFLSRHIPVPALL